jgi:hypothetical protein
MYPIQKRKRGQSELDATQKLMNKVFSSVRQPIESFFQWVFEKPIFKLLLNYVQQMLY